MADTCGDPLDCDDIRLGSAAILAASYVRLADGPNGELRTARRVTSCTGGGGGGGIVNTVAWSNQYGMYLTVDSGTASAPVFEPVGTESIIKTIAQIGHGLTLGQAVRLNGGAYVAAQGNSAANAAFVGFVLEVVSANQFRLLAAGHSAGAPAAMFSGLTAGTAAYLSPSSAGALTNTPNAFGPVLMPTSATAGYVLSNADSIALFTSPANTRASLGLPNVYAAIVSQVGGGAPTVAGVTNQLGGTPVLAYVAGGEYTLTITGAFTENKTYISLVNDSGALGIAGAFRTNVNTITILTVDPTFSSNDGILNSASLIVSVYP